MPVIYDNWERLVAAVVKREEIWQLCHQHSRSPSICSDSSDFSSNSRLRPVRGDESPDKGAAAVLPRFCEWNENDPQSAETYTHIFNKVREERMGNVKGTPKHPSFNSSDVKKQKKDKSVPKLVFLGRGPTPGFHLKETLESVRELGSGTFGASILVQLLEDVKVSDQEFLAKRTKLVMKLLSEVEVTEEEFKQQMMVFGSCRHENVAAPRAYYFSDKPNGKLIIYDYHSQGSISDMLHGDRSFPNWESRLRIAIGAARGIAYIHAQCGGKMAHGNIKSSNIFLNSPQYGCVCDFSLAGIMKMAPKPRGRGQDAAAHEYFKSVSQEMDVYNFGNLLLELLTGKSPLEAQGFDKDLELVTWVRSIKSEERTLKLFDQRLRRPIRNKKDLIEMVKTEIPGADLMVQDSATDMEALRAILGSHFRSMARAPASYFRAQELTEMVEMLRVAMRCLAVFRKDRPKMSNVALMLENIASMSDRKQKRAQNHYDPDDKDRLWKNIFPLRRSKSEIVMYSNNSRIS